MNSAEPQVEHRKPRYLKPEDWLKKNPGLFGRDTFYQRLRDGSIPHVRCGRRLLVREDVLDLMQSGGDK